MPSPRPKGRRTARYALAGVAAAILSLSGPGCVKQIVKSIFPYEDVPPEKVLLEEHMTPPGGDYEHLVIDDPMQRSAIFYRNPNLGNTIAVNGLCGKCEELSDYKQLSRNLLFPIDERELISEGWDEVAGQKALHRKVQGVFEGAPVIVESYVFTTDPCVFDLIYVSRVERYEADLAVYEEFVNNFVIQHPRPEQGLKPTAACIKRSP